MTYPGDGVSEFSHDEPAVKLPRTVKHPATECDNCDALIYIGDVECWNCHRRYGESELRDRWDKADHPHE